MRFLTLVGIVRLCVGVPTTDACDSMLCSGSGSASSSSLLKSNRAEIGCASSRDFSSRGFLQLEDIELDLDVSTLSLVRTSADDVKRFFCELVIRYFSIEMVRGSVRTIRFGVLSASYFRDIGTGFALKSMEIQDFWEPSSPSVSKV